MFSSLAELAGWFHYAESPLADIHWSLCASTVICRRAKLCCARIVGWLNLGVEFRIRIEPLIIWQTSQICSKSRLACNQKRVWKYTGYFKTCTQNQKRIASATFDGPNKIPTGLDSGGRERRCCKITRNKTACIQRGIRICDHPYSLL